MITNTYLLLANGQLDYTFHDMAQAGHIGDICGAKGLNNLDALSEKRNARRDEGGPVFTVDVAQNFEEFETYSKAELWN